MTSQTTFYLSQILGKKFISAQGENLGKIKDFLIDVTIRQGNEAEPIRPKVVAVKVRSGQQVNIYDFSSFELKRFKGEIRIICHEINEVSAGLMAVSWSGSTISV